MFGKKTGKKIPKLDYDKMQQKPVLHCSICTGEQVAGLKDLHTGRFQEVMAIRSPEDLERFRQMTGLQEFEKEY